MGKKVLVVDDEQSIVTLLKYNLMKEGYDVVAGYNGQEALKLVETEHPNLIILDLMLPELDGMEVCRIIRRGDIHIPILMLTAKEDEIDKILGLELGADDYMTKPFSPREVIARIKAILRRVEQSGEINHEPSIADERIISGDLELYPKKYEIYLAGEKIDLTPKEFSLLHYFIKNKGRVLSREQLLDILWNYDYDGGTRVVDVHVSHLREKISGPKTQNFIKTIRGIGYKFESRDG